MERGGARTGKSRFRVCTVSLPYAFSVALYLRWVRGGGTHGLDWDGWVDGYEALGQATMGRGLEGSVKIAEASTRHLQGRNAEVVTPLVYKAGALRLFFNVVMMGVRDRFLCNIYFFSWLGRFWYSAETTILKRRESRSSG